MKYLKTDINGGFPFVSDDLKWIQDANKEVIVDILKAFNLPSNINCILYGCEVNDMGSYYSINPGAILLGGEVCKVDAHTVNKPSGILQNYWVYDVQWDSQGLKVFEDGNSHNTYQITKAKVIKSLLGIAPLNIPRLINLITNYAANNLVNYLEPKKYIGTPGNPPFLNGFANNSVANSPLYFYKDLQNRVHLHGIIANVSQLQSNWMGLFQLPPGYRCPTYFNWIVPTVEYINGGYTESNQRIETDPSGVFYLKRINYTSSGIYTSSITIDISYLI